jgi:hypothetical protein
LDALLAQLNAGPALGDFAPKLAHNVDKARMRKVDAEALCRASNVKKTKKRLQQATKELTLYVHRLNGLAARKKLDPAVRQLFIDEGTPIQRDLRTLRGALHCPDDAPQRDRRCRSRPTIRSSPRTHARRRKREAVGFVVAEDVDRATASP